MVYTYDIQIGDLIRDLKSKKVVITGKVIEIAGDIITIKKESGEVWYTDYKFRGNTWEKVSKN